MPEKGGEDMHAHISRNLTHEPGRDVTYSFLCYEHLGRSLVVVLQVGHSLNFTPSSCAAQGGRRLWTT